MRAPTDLKIQFRRRRKKKTYFINPWKKIVGKGLDYSLLLTKATSWVVIITHCSHSSSDWVAQDKYWEWWFIYYTRSLLHDSNIDSGLSFQHQTATCYTLLLWQCFRASFSAASTMSTLALLLLHPINPTRSTWNNQKTSGSKSTQDFIRSEE